MNNSDDYFHSVIELKRRLFALVCRLFVYKNVFNTISPIIKLNKMYL